MKRKSNFKKISACIMAFLLSAGNLSLPASGLLTAAAETETTETVTSNPTEEQGATETASSEDTVPVQTETTAEMTETINPTDIPETSGKKAVRTIMLYDCGADLETKFGMATFNLHQILQANFSADEDVRFIVMTGGSQKWQIESESLYDPATDSAPAEISSEYNQIWEAKGSDAPENAGKMVLLDGDGISGDGETAKTASEEHMTDPETLKSFINYAAENYPADSYDLILWNHGGGPSTGFGSDENNTTLDMSNMSFAGLIDAFSDNAVTRNGRKFDFIDFDACLMSSVDLTLAFADYADYYIASPESEPGYGQEYSGWLNVLGENPGTDTYELGKKIVDDFIAFYESEETEGHGQKGTLAVIDTRKLLESDFVSALTDFNAILHHELLQPDADGEYLYYDELFSNDRAISYGSMEMYLDLGNMMNFLSVKTKELKLDNISGEDVDNTSAYTDTAQRILKILENPEIIYARGTNGFGTEEDVYRQSDGTLKYGTLGTSGIYLPAFKADGDWVFLSLYFKQMDAALEKMPDDNRRQFLKDYLDTLNDYYLMTEAGRAVGAVLNSGIEKSEISYDTLKSYWTGGIGKTEEEKAANSYQWSCIQESINRHIGGEEAVKAMLEPIIRQQAEEAILTDNVSIELISGSEANRYLIKIEDTQKRIIDNIGVDYTAELPAVEEYANQPENAVFKIVISYLGQLSLGHRDATMRMDDDMELSENILEDYINWYHQPSGSWSIDSIGNKWYAVKDASGTLHAVQVDTDRRFDSAFIYAKLRNEDGEQLAVLLFDENHKLTSIATFDEDLQSQRQIPVSELTEEIELMPINLVNFLGVKIFYVPISLSSFTLSAENADQFELVYTDIKNIPDIADTDGDGKSVTEKLVVRDIYGYQYDISDKTENPVKVLTNIGDAEVLPAVYDGTEQKPVVMMGDKVLEEGVDYTILKYSEDDTFTEPGTYQIIIVGKGEYSEGKLAVFEILPAEDFASPEEFARMAKIDYEKKHGIAVTPEIIENADGTITINLNDASGNIADTYQLNVKTGIGKDADGGEVNLPQTGNNTLSTAAAVAGACMLTLTGAFMTVKSALSFRKKNKKISKS